MPAQLLDTVPCQKQQALPQLLATSILAGLRKFLSVPWGGPGAPNKQKWRNKIVGIFVVGSPVCFAKTNVAGPVFGFPANFSKNPEWALERQTSKIAETKCITSILHAALTWKRMCWTHMTSKPWWTMHARFIFISQLSPVCQSSLPMRQHRETLLQQLVIFRNTASHI